MPAGGWVNHIDYFNTIAEEIMATSSTETPIIQRLSPISEEAFKRLDLRSQQEVAILVGQMNSPQPLSAEEEKKLRELVEHANLEQHKAEYSAGLDLIINGHCTLIRPEAFDFLDPRRQERLATYVGRKLLQKTAFSAADSSAMNDLAYLAKLKQEAAVTAPDKQLPQTTSVSSSVFSSVSSFFYPVVSYAISLMQEKEGLQLRH